MSRKHILIVDDEPDIRNLISDILADEGYSVMTAANGEEANQQIKARQPNLILLDIWMPDIDGISLMKSWNKEQLVTAPIVMMSGHGTVETAVEATRLGAKDFIEKPLSLAKLLQTVADTLAQSEQIIDDTNNNYTTIIEPVGNSAVINQIKATLEKIYKTKNHIFIEGENGTGKYSTAMLIHHKRHAHKHPCVLLDALNVDSNFEKSLTQSDGYFMRAKQGTLVINNIDSLPIDQQKILLSCLKYKQFNIYEQNTARTISFQIITISQKDIYQLVNENRFSNELYELLAEVKLTLPTLKDRQEDIPELINFYVNTLPDSENTPYRKMSFAAQNLLRNHSWKNNIIELKNTVRQLQLLGGEGEISKDEVSTLLSQTEQSNTTEVNHWYNMPLREAREAFEKDYLIYQLKAVDGRVGKLAKIAGMERTHLYRKLRALNINPKDIIKP
ncbi:Nitrogen regulation protein NtrX [hydrothermal vent metagenome]|uniref:Nitrogen regulation protein NtrX n=1 Tax=hydrothermal vent metagenome TaxID=652676 RepID=A0A3B0VZD6_9ZZZZ